MRSLTRPDLLLIDGGGTPCAGGLPGAETMGLDIPALRHGEGRPPPDPALVAPDGEEIGIQGYPGGVRPRGARSRRRPTRFAIEFNRQQRKVGRVRGSVLDRILGWGEAAQRAFEALQKASRAIRGAATVEELEQVVPENAAQAVYSILSRNVRVRSRSWA